MSRFDYVKFGPDAQSVQEDAKKKCQALEAFIEEGPDSRAKSLALTKLEECYMWIGKMIRDEQIATETEDVEMAKKEGLL